MSVGVPQKCCWQPEREGAVGWWYPPCGKTRRDALFRILREPPKDPKIVCICHLPDALAKWDWREVVGIDF